MANNSLLEALGSLGSGALNVLDMPGSYLRGGLAGRLGERLSGSELLNTYTKPLLGVETDGVGTVAADMIGGLIDPISLIPGGALLGSKAAGGVGKWLATNAAKRGPQYGTKLDDILPLLPNKTMPHKLQSQIGLNSGITPGGIPEWQGWQDTLKAYPQIASEIPPGSVPIGGRTAEALVLHHPQTGQVTKIMSPRLATGNIPEPRLDIADMIQPSRSKLFTKPAGAPDDVFPSLRVEHEPFMEIGKVPPPAFKQMAGHLEGQGVSPWDIWDEASGYNKGNLGATPTGQIFVTDAGAIRPAAPGVPVAESIQGEANPFAALLLRLMGSGNKMQKELAAAAKTYRGGSYGSPLTLNLDEATEMAQMMPTRIARPVVGTPTRNIRGG